VAVVHSNERLCVHIGEAFETTIQKKIFVDLPCAAFQRNTVAVAYTVESAAPNDSFLVLIKARPQKYTRASVEKLCIQQEALLSSK